MESGRRRRASWSDVGPFDSQTRSGSASLSDADLTGEGERSTIRSRRDEIAINRTLQPDRAQRGWGGAAAGADVLQEKKGTKIYRRCCLDSLWPFCCSVSVSPTLVVAREQTLPFVARSVEDWNGVVRSPVGQND